MVACVTARRKDVMLVSIWHCCDRKSRAAYAQSFALWQQATTEFICHDHSSRTLLLRSVVDIASITRDYTPRSLCYCLFAPHIWMVLFCPHIPFVVNHTINTTLPERCNNIPSFLQRTAPIARSLCEGWTPHDLHILVTAPFCCDRKSRAAYAQSFALWQQATIEFTCHDHSSRTLLLRSIVDIVSITRDYTPRSLYDCLLAPHICMVLFFTHIPFVVNHTINATPP